MAVGDGAARARSIAVIDGLQNRTKNSKRRELSD